MNDRLGAVGGPAEALRVGHVALDELAAPGPQAVLLLGPAREHAHGQLLGAEGVDHVPTHEPGSADHQDAHSEKFFQ